MENICTNEPYPDNSDDCDSSIELDTDEFEDDELIKRYGDNQAKFVTNNLNKPQRVEKLPTKYTVPEILDQIGGFGFAQWYSFFSVLLCNTSVSLYFYNLPFLELMPQILCKNGNNFGACTLESV